MPGFRSLLCAIAVAGVLIAGNATRAPVAAQDSSPLPTPTRTGETNIPFHPLAASTWRFDMQGNEVTVLPDAAVLRDLKAVEAAGLRPYLVTNLQEAHATAGLVGVTGASLLAEVDYEEEVALVISFGVTSSCCAPERVVRIAAGSDGTIVIYTVVTTSSGMATADQAVAVAVYTIQRNDLPAGFSPQTPMRTLRSVEWVPSA